MRQNLIWFVRQQKFCVNLDVHLVFQVFGAKAFCGSADELSYSMIVMLEKR